MGEQFLIFVRNFACKCFAPTGIIEIKWGDELCQEISSRCKPLVDISMGDGNVFTINQIIQITAAEVQTCPLNKASPYRGLQKFEWKDKDIDTGVEK